MTYTAKVWLDEFGWWIVDVDGVGVTQARTPSEAHRMAIDYIEGMLDEPGADVELEFTGPEFHEVTALRRRQAEAERVIAETSTAMRKAVDDLLSRGFKKADVAAMLNVSRQRVTQLSPNSKAEITTTTKPRSGKVASRRGRKVASKRAPRKVSH